MIIVGILACSLFAGCKETPETSEVIPTTTEDSPKTKPKIRYISLDGKNGKFGLELNGDRAFIRDNSAEETRSEVSYQHGLALLQEFYDIDGIERYRGTNSDNRQTSKQVLVTVYDEEPQYYSEDTVDYIFSNQLVTAETEIGAWLGRMQSLRESTE
ncbi:hypothetical protein V2O64_24565 (plasmid) [Verrucomicrobiaceae bacterium 227]